MSRILVVGINYAPEHAGIAPYTTWAAEHWARQGHEVRVLTGVDHYPHWTVPEDMRRRLRRTETRNAVRITRLRHHVASRQSALRRGLYEATFGLHAAVATVWRPDVVVSVVPSLMGALAGTWHAARSHAPHVVWVQDLMSQAASQSGIAGGGRAAAATATAERMVLKRASRVAIVSEAFRDCVVELGAAEARVTVLPNWTHVEPPAADRTLTRKRLGWDDHEIIALHSGNMGLKQGLENIVEAARRASSDGDGRVRFLLMGEGS